MMTAPLNTDVDSHVTMTATAAAGAVHATTQPATAGTVYVDAVADNITPWAGQTHMIFVTDSNDSGNAFGNNETGAVEVKAIFGDVHDGSELHSFTVHLQSGFTAGLSAAGTITGLYNSVSTSFSYTYNAGTGDVVVTVPNDIVTDAVLNQTAAIDLSFAVTAPADVSTLPDSLTFNLSATANENPPTDGGCNPDHSDIAGDNVLTVTDTTGIPAARLLSGHIITNTPTGSQEMILTFVDQDHPLDAFAQLFVRDAQGQQGAVTSDAGFNITPSDHFQVVLENPIVGHKVIVTQFDLNGVTIGSGNLQLEYDGSSGKPDAVTSVIQPSGSNTAAAIDSQDGDQNANILTDATPNQFNDIYGAEANDTVNGSADSDVLNGGTGADILKGNAGNDILVYDTADIAPTAIDGGTGFDILRIDQGALYNTGAFQGGFAVPGITNATVDLAGKLGVITNIEEILLTEEAHADASLGTMLTDGAGGLTFNDVVGYTGGSVNIQTGTANTLFIVGSQGDDVQLAAGWTEQAATYTSSGGELFHQWTQSVSAITATIFIDNDLQVNHAAQ